MPLWRVERQAVCDGPHKKVAFKAQSPVAVVAARPSVLRTTGVALKGLRAYATRPFQRSTIVSTSLIHAVSSSSRGASVVRSSCASADA